MPERNIHSILWQGDFSMLHSISLTNQKLKPHLEELGYNLITAPTDRPKTLQIDPLPDVFIHHNYPFDVISAPGKMNVLFIQYEYRKLLDRHEYIAPRLNAFFDLLIVSSKFVKDAFLRSGVRIPIEICPLGCDPKEFSPSTPPINLSTRKSFRFLNLGGAIHRKGLDLLLKTYTRTFSKEDDVCLVLKAFSYPQYLAWINEQIDHLEKDPNAPEVIFIHDEPETIAGYYTSSDVGVYPYRGEGFGLTILESLACGRPVIVTEGGSTDDFCNSDNAWFVPSQEKQIDDMLLLEPDELRLGHIMRETFERGSNGGKDPLEISKSVESLTWKSSANILSGILERAYRNRLKMSVNSSLKPIEGSPALILYNYEDMNSMYKEFPNLSSDFREAIPDMHIIDLQSPPLNHAPPWMIGITGQSYEHFHRAKKINPVTKLILIHDDFPVDRAEEVEGKALRSLGDLSTNIHPQYKSLYNWRLEQEVQLADTVLVFDDVTQKHLDERFPNKSIIQVLPPISTDAKISLPASDTFTVLFTGSRPLQQGIKLLFEAWDQLKLPDAQLQCILSGKFALTSKYLLKILMKNPNIHISDFHSILTPAENQIENIFANSHILINPAIEDGFFMLAGKLFGQGKPLIVSDTSGMASLVAHQIDGYVFRSGDVDALKAGIRFFYERKDQLRPFCKAAYGKAQKYTKAGFVEQTLSIVNQITGTS